MPDVVGKLPGAGGNKVVICSRLAAFPAAVTARPCTNTGINLTVSDGTHTANLALSGAIASTFVISSDGNDGTLITDPALDQHTKLTTPHTKGRRLISRSALSHRRRSS